MNHVHTQQAVASSSCSDEGGEGAVHYGALYVTRGANQAGERPQERTGLPRRREERLLRTESFMCRFGVRGQSGKSIPAERTPRAADGRRVPRPAAVGEEGSGSTGLESTWCEYFWNLRLLATGTLGGWKLFSCLLFVLPLLLLAFFLSRLAGNALISIHSQMC